MKFAHLADLHIGKYLLNKSLLEDQTYILDQILDLCKLNSVTTLLLSGDIYDRQIPSGEAVDVFNNFINKAINEYHLSIYLISGNHDSKERLNFGSDILKNHGLHIVTKITSPLTKIQINDSFGPLFIYFMPFSTPIELRVKFDANCKDFNEMASFLLENTPLDKKARNILLTHHTISGTKLTKSESETDIMIGGTEGFDYKLLKDFTYVALGHIHTPQSVGYDYIRYSGSILKYSESEACVNKTLTIVDLKEVGNVMIYELPLYPLHDLKRVTGYFEDLLKEEGSFDYIYFTLKDNQTIPNAMAILKTKYPNALSLKYENLESELNIVKATNTDNLTLDEQLNLFYNKIYERDIYKEELNLIKKLVKEEV